MIGLVIVIVIRRDNQVRYFTLPQPQLKIEVTACGKLRPDLFGCQSWLVGRDSRLLALQSQRLETTYPCIRKMAWVCSWASLDERRASWMRSWAGWPRPNLPDIRRGVGTRSSWTSWTTPPQRGGPWSPPAFPEWSVEASKTVRIRGHFEWMFAPLLSY